MHLQDLCRGLAQEFQLYVEYVRKLAFEERPDYELLRGMFREASDTAVAQSLIKLRVHLDWQI